MARHQGVARITGEAVAAATAETLIQIIAASNVLVAVLGYGVGGRGTSNTQQPGVIDILRQTTAGTASALTNVEDVDSLAESLVTTAQQDFTAEPTAGDVLRTHTLHPQSALDLRDSFSREIIVGGGDRLGLRVNFADAQTLDAYIVFEE